MSQPASESGPLITYGNITDAVSAQIREMILTNELQPGQWIRQSEIATRLGVSIMPVRECLRQLQAEGLVVFYPRRGAMVAELSLPAFEELDRISEELEKLACTWVAEDFSRIPREKMRQILGELEEAEAQGDIPRRLRLVREFRFIIWEATEKPHLLRLVTSVCDSTTPYRRLFSSVDDIAPARVEVYRNIYGACEAQDLEALLEAMSRLYDIARRTIFNRLSDNT